MNSEQASATASSSTDQSGQPPFTRKNSLGYQINHLARLMTQALSEAVEPYGVVPGQFAQLLSLYENDGQTVTELARDVAIQHPTMSRTLARMERDGLVERRADPDDARASRIYLTAHARSLKPDLITAAEEINARFTKPLDPTMQTRLVDAIDLIIESTRSLESDESA